ncbi:MAG TPA: hypothetical protein VGH20_01230 [Myxococcales bacterium]|jgi:hypothetical protein
MDAKLLARLFEAPLEEFVQARNALVRELRGKGKDEEAKAVAGVRKPSKALWLVNDVARREPAQVKSLIAATARLRKAQEKGASGDDLREAMREQREALNALTAAAGDASVERRVRDTLQAAAMSQPDALREGRIEEELQPAGFDAVFGLEIAPRAHAPAAKHGGAKGSANHEAAHGGTAHGRSHASGGGTKTDAPAAKREAEAKKQREQELRAARKEAGRLAAHAKKLEAAAAQAGRDAANADKAAADAQRAADNAREQATAAAAEARTARNRATEAELHVQRLG